MYLSINWLKDFVKIPEQVSPQEIASRLNQHTVEVEKTIIQDQQFAQVVIGKVLTVKKHPNADRLRVTTVDVGKEELTIVCGAPNVAEGQFVAVALVGATLPNGLVIKEAEIRGEKSYGMICAEDELGLGTNHEGIMVLDKRAKIGSGLADYLGMNDAIMEVDNKSLSNRPDLWGHYGLARELSVLFNVELNEYKPKEIKSEGQEKIKIEVQDEKACPRYMAVMIKNIKIAPSPQWLQDRLLAIGSRPINNIVDITNYVMLESGQPLHAFDARKVDKIGVRLAKNGEKIITLDDKERILTHQDIVIVDSEGPIALAGVMGGKNSEVDDGTVSLIIESANFNSAAIRKTAQRLALRSESSIRFEKSLDPENCPLALRRAVELIKEIVPSAKVGGELIDIKHFSHHEHSISLSLAWLEKVIGAKIPAEKVMEILYRLGFKVNFTEVKKTKSWLGLFSSKEQPENFIVQVPSWRAKDINIPEDLAEEIARIYGYNNIDPRMPEITLDTLVINQDKRVERLVKDILVLEEALTETRNYVFISEEQIKKLGGNIKNYLQIANPIASNQNILRQELATNLLANIKNNQAQGNIALFEIGNIFLNQEGIFDKEGNDEEKLPYQEKRLALVFSSDNEEIDRVAKGSLENLFWRLSSSSVTYQENKNIPTWADNRESAGIYVNNQLMGIIAVVSKKTLEALGLKKKTIVMEINFSHLVDLVLKSETKYKPLPKYPALIRDLAFVLSSEIVYNDIKNDILKFDPLIKEVDLFDIYQGSSLEEGKKSLAFHVSYQANDHTLTSEEVDIVVQKLLKHLAEKYQAQIRNF